MPKRNDLVYIGHMLDMARKAWGKAEGKTRYDFDRDEDLRIVLTHLLQIIGEAARRVSDEYRAANPRIPWLAIIGMRHKVVHDYMSVDEDAVWNTVQHDLPELINLLRPLVRDNYEEG